MPLATEDNGEFPSMEEAQLLVPWYIAGKLDDAEARKIEELAYHDKEFAKLIVEANREAEAIASLSKAMGNPPSDLWARIEKSVEQERKARSRSWLDERAAGLKSAIAGLFAGLSAPQWQALAAAAVAICVIEAGAIAYLASSDNTSAKFRTASGPKAEISARHSAFIVSFWDTATIGEINKALDDAGVAVVEGPNADMLYRLALRNDNVGAKDQAYAKLQASGLVKLILPEK